MRRSIILDAAVESVFPAMIMFSLYLLFAGHNQPGGGFAGGLAAAGGFVLLYLARGLEAVRQRTRLRGNVIMGSGLLLAAAVGTIPMLVGAAFLESFIWQFELPLIGKVKLVSALFFDIGVYLIVAGMVLQLLEAFEGSRPPETPLQEESLT